MYKTEQIKVFIKTKCPACFLIMKQSRKFFCKFQRFLYKFTGIKYRFTRIYHTTSFGGEISASGPGSDFAQTKIIAQEIPFLVQELNVKVFLDAPCGDFYWMKNVKMDVEKYIGVDIFSNPVIIGLTLNGNNLL